MYTYFGDLRIVTNFCKLAEKFVKLEIVATISTLMVYENTVVRKFIPICHNSAQEEMKKTKKWKKKPSENNKTRETNRQKKGWTFLVCTIYSLRRLFLVSIMCSPHYMDLLTKSSLRKLPYCTLWNGLRKVAPLILFYIETTLSHVNIFKTIP